MIGADKAKQLRAQQYYEKHRYMTFKGGDVTRTATKSLSKGYEHERAMWEKSNKQANISGSAVHTLFDLNKKKALPDFQDDKITRKVQKILKKNVDALQADDWLVVQQYLIDKKIENSDANSTQCLYLKKDQRLLTLALINGRGLFENYEGNLFTAGDGDAQLYVMDRYGALYTGANIGGKNKPVYKQNKFVNHSSITSGKEVICAGTITILNGQLTSITNNSGHYKPTKENLQECVKVLQKEGADLSRTIVIAMIFTTGTKMAHIWNPGAGKTGVDKFLSGADADEVVDAAD
jgi:hypothetical protein